MYVYAVSTVATDQSELDTHMHYLASITTFLSSVWSETRVLD